MRAGALHELQPTLPSGPPPATMGLPNFEDESAAIETDDAGRTATIHMPKALGSYRLYVDVADERGLDEANTPLVVRPAP